MHFIWTTFRMKPNTFQMNGPRFAASTALPLDVHWITGTPDIDFIQTLNEMNVDSLAIQSTKLTDELVVGLQEFEGAKKGVGICISDGSESVFPFLDLIDYVLLMSGETRTLRWSL